MGAGTLRLVDAVGRYLRRPGTGHGVARLHPGRMAWMNRDAFSALYLGEPVLVGTGLRVSGRRAQSNAYTAQVASSVSAEHTTAETAAHDVERAEALLTDVCKRGPRREQRALAGAAFEFEVVALDNAGRIVLLDPNGSVRRRLIEQAT